ncbi:MULTISPECIES: hypothetical protein [unclassified Isoptericola]|uniref:hypothetical protein n=1 Tax=unclassified Isoptericola TaxID=2623355 RepID=UPI003659B4C7
MCEQLTADTGAMQETGNRLVSHGYAMSTTLSDDVSGCGSQGVEDAVVEFAMSVVVELEGIKAQVLGAGNAAKDSAAEIEAADAALAGSAR